jgi:bud site selection protein 31
MPKPPAGFDAVNIVLDRYDVEMRSAVAASSQGLRKVETTWEIARINRERTRWLFDELRHGRTAAAVVEYCVAQRFVDGELMRIWRLPGYETACCSACVQTCDNAFGSTCACRVPKDKRSISDLRCANCGCSGCASCDVAAARRSEMVPAGEANKRPRDEGEDGLESRRPTRGAPLSSAVRSAGTPTTSHDQPGTLLRVASQTHLVTDGGDATDEPQSQPDEEHEGA